MAIILVTVENRVKILNSDNWFWRAAIFMLHLFRENFLLIRSKKGWGCWILFSVKAIKVSKQWWVTYLLSFICHFLISKDSYHPRKFANWRPKGNWPNESMLLGITVQMPMEKEISTKYSNKKIWLFNLDTNWGLSLFTMLGRPSEYIYGRFK